MARVTRFDTPASLRDLPAGSPFYDKWDDFIDEELARSTLGTNFGEFYDASEIDVNILGMHAMVWMAFPRDVLMPNRDNRRDAWIAADRTPGGDIGNRMAQNEYCEWRVDRNAAGKITRVTFTTEVPEYWEEMWKVDPARVVALYRSLVSPAVVEADLQFSDGRYKGHNRWNGDEGIVHLIVGENTLKAALGLAEGSTYTRGPLFTGVPAPSPYPLTARDNHEMPAVRDTSVDPRVEYDVAALVRKPLSVTVREPIGLYITGYDDTGWTKPDGSPVGNYWKIIRGSPGQILRLEYRVPAAAGFVVGDIRIGGRRIKWGGQIAEHVTVMISGIAGVRP